jgi:hypothetical protein
MTVEEALQIIEQVCSGVPMIYADHLKCRQAIKTLADAARKPEVKPSGE